MTREIRNRLNERWAYLPSDSHQNSKLAMFVHGYAGNYLDTWGDLADLLCTHADTKRPFRDWDYMFRGYNTWDIDSYLDIATLISTELKVAEIGARPYISRYDEFALIGHSLGTLGIRQFLCDWKGHSKGLLSKLHSITLFGSPIAGSFLARFGVGAIADGLKPKGAQLRMLKRWLDCAYDHEHWPEVQLVVGVGDRVVGHTDSYFVQWHNDVKEPERISQDNIDMVTVKPRTPEASPY